MKKVQKNKVSPIGLDKEYALSMGALKAGMPVLLYGPTGNGKTVLANKLADDYSKEFKVPVVYLQLYPEMSKNTLIGGETIKNGSIVINKQAIATFGAKGAIFVVDEATHALEHVLLAFNSLIEEPNSTIVGTEVVTMNPKTRFVFCGNTPDHTGNIHLPISMANRLFILKMGLPNKEVLKKIASMFCPIPQAEPLIDFVADIITKVHEPSFPVSPRNAISFVKMLPFLCQTGFNDPKDKRPNEAILKVCQELRINTDTLKDVIVSTLMGNVVINTDSPCKVAALTW